MKPTLALLLLAASPLLAQSDDVEVTSLLAIEGVSRGGRVAILADAVMASLAQGAWSTPAEGDTVALPGEEPGAWRAVEFPRNENGWHDGPNLRRGYGCATVVSPDERVVMVEVRGVRHYYANGEPRMADIYNLGISRLPVLLREGENQLLFKGGRGNLRLRIDEAEASATFLRRDATLPDVLRGGDRSLWLGVPVVHAAEGWTELAVRVSVERDGEYVATEPASTVRVGPLSVVQAPVRLEVPDELPEGPLKLRLDLFAGARTQPSDSMELQLAVKEADAKHNRTFRSGIDGSVQYFGVTPMARTEDSPERPALFLSCHGASVQASRQANSYAHKDWGVVVAPTNRRPFGFDWEDWGRLDALEVFAIAEEAFDTDPRRTYLTGHSMGGHGTWNLGVHFPDRFAAIAPSAGWRDFWSYGGAAEYDDPGPVEEMLLRACNGSRTLLLERNLLHGGVYVLHGDKDNNVPVSQARFMRERLASFHPNFAYYERPGAGHWWGNQCMDWPPLFDFLRDNVLPAEHAVREVEYHTVHPAISSECHWVAVEAQEHSMELSRVEVSIDLAQRQIGASTTNVSRLAFDLSAFAEPRTREQDGEEVDATLLPAGEGVQLAIDGQVVDLAWPEGGSTLRVKKGRADGAWTQVGELAAWYKGPHRAGPFKSAFENDVLLVYGTAGSPAETAWGYAKARYDAEQFAYRANGAFDVVADTDFGHYDRLDRNVVLYGNADTNRVWDRVLTDKPFELRAGRLRFAERELEGDAFSFLVVYPRKGSDVASVGVVGGTGLAGMRATDQLPYFVSGTGFPDWMVMGPEVLTRGVEGVLGAGYFRDDWSPIGADEAWR